MTTLQYYFVLCSILTLLNFFAFSHFYFGRMSNRYYEMDDLHSLVNLTNFDYLIAKPPVVQVKDANNVTLPDFVILIHTDPYHEAVRKVIRDTWSQSDPRALTYFMLGAVNTTQKQAEIEAENREHGDIIQGNFIDAYHNLTYKHVMCLKWFKDNCAGIKYMVKMDDDVFMNVPAVYEYLQQNKQTENFLMGLLVPPSKVMRSGKWIVADEDRLEDWYPPYASGCMTIYSADLVRALYKETKTTPFFWVDDVYVTGMCRSKLNNKIVPLNDHLLDYRIQQNESAVYTKLDFMFSMYSTTPEEMIRIWNKTEDYRKAHGYIDPTSNKVEYTVS